MNRAMLVLLVGLAAPELCEGQSSNQLGRARWASALGAAGSSQRPPAGSHQHLYRPLQGLPRSHAGIPGNAALRPAERAAGFAEPVEDQRNPRQGQCRRDGSDRRRGIRRSARPRRRHRLGSRLLARCRSSRGFSGDGAGRRNGRLARRPDRGGLVGNGRRSTVPNRGAWPLRWSLTLGADWP